MNKPLLSVLLWWLGAQAFAGQPTDIVKRHYPKSLPHLQCRLAQTDGNAYCMRLLKSERRTTPHGNLLYLLYGGHYYNPKTGQEEDIHMASGLAGMFVLREKMPGRWETVAASPFNSVGAFGQAPAKAHWTFHEFGKDKWGFLTEHSDMHHGHAGSHYVILAHDGGRNISPSWLGGSADNTGAYGERCEYAVGEDDTLSPAERQTCLRHLNKIGSTIKILRDQTAVNGFYPLRITLNGAMGKRRFRNQAYLITFDAKQGAFAAPKNYPLNTIDY